MKKIDDLANQYGFTKQYADDFLQDVLSKIGNTTYAAAIVEEIALEEEFCYSIFLDKILNDISYYEFLNSNLGTLKEKRNEIEKLIELQKVKRKAALN